MLTYGISCGTAGETALDDVSRTGVRGTLYLNSSTGVYTYVPSNDPGNALAAPTTETPTITVSDGTLSGSQTYKVTIGVANAAAGTPAAIGKLINTDVYNTANTFTAVSSPRPNSSGYGAFMMTAAGVWSYTLDNANSAVQALDVGDTLTDTFTVTTAVVTVTIRGSTMRAPTISTTSPWGTAKYPIRHSSSELPAATPLQETAMNFKSSMRAPARIPSTAPARMTLCMQDPTMTRLRAMTAMTRSTEDPEQSTATTAPIPSSADLVATG